MTTKEWIIAAVVVLIVIIAAYAGYMYWKKNHPAGFKPHSHHHAAMKLAGAHSPAEKMSAPYYQRPPRPYHWMLGEPAPASVAAREGFGGMDWPQSDTFGAMADTYPYGNYADGLQMYYPTYDEYAALWTRS